MNPIVAHAASRAARLHIHTDQLRFRLQVGELPLIALLNQPFPMRKSVVETGPFINIYLGKTRVYKRISYTLIFSFCPEIGRFLAPHDEGELAIKFPEGFSNVLSVKLAIQYMENYVIHSRFRGLPWKVRGDISTYIFIAEVFGRIDEFGFAHQALKTAIMRRLYEMPLSKEQVSLIWMRETPNMPSRYARALATNIATYSCVTGLERLKLEWDVEPGEGLEERVEKRIAALAARLPEHPRLNQREAARSTAALDEFLEEKANVALKQLVYTADPFTPPDSVMDPEVYIAICLVKQRLPSMPHITGLQKILMKKKTDKDGLKM
ncbi:hypothetical protein CC80DRAFT_423379 [Byssothecium circinans]|uniref:Uncharacterized protein n=1 Tax=Byssothecium circinans TaxID=147558 RepID=A0A6A5TK31_9PLEO|nr:hypothetical protein CC80DRAFT_423379 [Byssothecium circinans]